jgi:hypothetical protein
MLENAAMDEPTVRGGRSIHVLVAVVVVAVAVTLFVVMATSNTEGHAAGAEPLTGYQIVEGPEIKVPRQDGLAIGNAPCPRGKRALGGGFASDASTINAYITAPNFSGTAWVLALRNTEASPGPDATVRPFATCAFTG